MRARLLSLGGLLLAACGARTDLGGARGLDAGAIFDATPDVADSAIHDASADEAVDEDAVVTLDAPQLCDFGTLVSDPFGSTVLWNGGAPLPKGHYRVTYVDGCMKYSSGQGWTVNAYADGPDTLFVVTNGDAPVGTAPGTVGFTLGSGGFASFDDCVSTNTASDAPLEFDFAGGVLGLRLEDSPYADNVSGPNGRNPTYRLSSCP